MPGVPSPTPPGALLPSLRARCPKSDTTRRIIALSPRPVSPPLHHRTHTMRIRQIAAPEDRFCAMGQWLRCATGRLRPPAHGGWPSKTSRRVPMCGCLAKQGKDPEFLRGGGLSSRGSRIIGCKKDLWRAEMLHIPPCEVGNVAFSRLQRGFCKLNLGFHEMLRVSSMFPGRYLHAEGPLREPVRRSSRGRGSSRSRRGCRCFRGRI